jgi:hypothetical protein
LSPVHTVSLSVALGIELDDQDRPRLGADPRVESIDIRGDGVELMRMSRRRADGQGSTLRLDRLASDHFVFRQVVKAIVESTTTSDKVLPEDFDSANKAIASLLPELQVRIAQFFPAGVELPRLEGADLAPQSMLFPISRGNRSEDVANAVRFVLPRTLNELVRGVSEVLADELRKLQYLGPLRSFPPRHLAFAEHEDVNWYAGGGYAWDLVRRDDTVRSAVNEWLGSKKLRTPYRLTVRSLIALDQMSKPIEAGLERIQDEGLEVVGEQPTEYSHGGYQAIITDVEASAQSLVTSVGDSDADRVKELVLLDQRSKTIVTHRDVGIGISQVLPVLVMAYGSHGKLLAMEQPEIHLHPALQAELGDVFIEAALGERGNTLILETHSEHLMLRLMRRMKESHYRKETGLPPITPNDISVMYVEPDGARSIAREMPLNELGQLVKSWPGGFFEEGLREQFDHA